MLCGARQPVQTEYGNKINLIHFKVQKFKVSEKLFSEREMNTYIQQGCIKLIKTDSKDIYNVRKDYCLKKVSVFLQKY